ncbi:MAG: DsbA family protein [Alphaproteobacteria bacterium]
MKKSNPALPFIVIALVIGIVALAIYFFVKKSDKKETDQENPAQVVNPSGLDKDKKISDVEGVEEVVAKWIEANPQAIINSVSNMQRKAMEEQMKNAQKNIGEKKSDLFNDKKTPQHAPSGYDVTIVEFYDYACGYCKKAYSTVNELIKSDKKVRVIFRDFPILGQPSREMAEVSVAVNLADSANFIKFHDNLMGSNDRGKDAAFKAVKSAGINVSKVEEVLKKDKAKIDKILEENLSLGTSIGINGTPGFVIGEELIPGALELAVLKEKISAQRKK